jgi:hypothetical protein
MSVVIGFNPPHIQFVLIQTLKTLFNKLFMNKYNLESIPQNKIYEIKEFDNSMKQLNALLMDLITDIKLNKGEQIAVLTQLSYGTGDRITIGKRYPIKINTTNLIKEKDIISYAELLNTQFKFMDNWYHELTFNRIIFNYILISDEEYIRMNQKDKISTQDILKENSLNSSVLMNLPLNQLYKGWGTKITIIDASSYKIEGLGEYYLVIKSDLNNLNVTTIFVYTNSGELVRTFIDRKISGTQFMRYTEGKEFHINKGQAYFYFQNLFSKMKNISKLSPMKNVNLNIITLDIETYLDSNSEMQIYCICFYDGESSKSYYITDYNNIESLIQDLFNELLRRKYSSNSIYIHNGSNFDLIFLLKYIVNLENVRIRPIIRDNKFINITLEYGPNYHYILYIKDSLLLLPIALDELAKSFGTDQQKLDFDHTKINQSNLLEFKDESIRYCIADCIALYQVLNNFNQVIYNLFEVNISESPTLPSLAFRIFRTNFLDNIKIPVLKGQIYKDISKSYYGGHVDMYKPTNDFNTKVYQYDVNALYPSAMLSNQYPTKLVGYFIGDISKIFEYKHISPLVNDKYIGFFKVEVSAPSLLNPILPYKLDNTTVYGEGTWTAWYATDEIKNAINYGYKFNILAGYIFKKESLFNRFVEVLNSIKIEATRNSPKYIIAKLLMNSLYGRFGMSPNLGKSIVIKSIDFNDFKNTVGIENILETINLDSKLLVTINEDFVKDSNINVSIASAVAANGRVHMSQFMNNTNLTGILYYMDTDSAFISKELPNNMVNNTILGYMKLENIYSKFIALGPKAYGGITINGEEIIKVKGLKSAKNLSLSDLKFRLVENFDDKLLNNKNFKSMFKATIKTKEVSYFLKPTNNKRELIFSNGYLIGTKNKIIKD